MKIKKRGLRALVAAAAVALAAFGFAPGAYAEGSAFEVLDKSGGSVGTYDTKTDAQNAMQDGYTFKLLQNYSGDWGITIPGAARDVIVDLNGYSVTCNKTDSKNGFAIKVEAGYSGARDCTVTIKNSGSTQAVLTSAYEQIRTGSGNIASAQVVKLEGDIAFKDLTDGEEPLGIKLGTGAKLLDTATARALVPNGGFSAKEADGNNYLYGNFANAAAKSSDGVVTMVNDFTGFSPIVSGHKNATLDLAGHTYTYTGDVAAINVNNPNVTLTIKNGNVIATNEQADGATLVGAPNAGQMNNRGLVLDGVKLTVSGTDVYGIVTNGTETGNTVTLRNSTLNVENGYGIYFPSTGSVTIDNSTINAEYTGVQMCAGDLSVTGNSVITVTGQPQAKTETDGPIADGAAISVVNRDGYKDLGNVTVSDGTFSSAAGVDPVKAYSFNNTDKTEGEWENSTEVVGVTGGTFSDDSVLKFAGDNVAFKGDDGFTVMTEEEALSSGAVASVATEDGTVYFATVKDAEDFAGDGEGAPEVTPVTWNVTFGLGEGVEGTAPTAQSVVNGSAATAPAAPERDGYKFLGWFAEGADEAYDFAAKVTSDLKLTAQWVKVWDVTFVFGTEADDMVVTVEDGTMVAAPEDPVYEGYTFVGWYTVMNEDGTLDEKSLFDFEGTAITEDLTLYGGWIEDGQEPEGPVVEPENKPAPEPDRGKLVQTGDASVLMMAASGIAGTAAIAAGYVASKRRK